MATRQVFLSHSSADKDVAERVALALRRAGADVWFDEHNLGATQLLDESQRQLQARPVFIVLLSKAAFGSEWVKRECKWAFNLQMRDPSRIILPVVISPIAPNAFKELRFLEDFKRVEGPNHMPYSEAEMLERTLRLLALTPAGQAPTPAAPQPAESVEDLMTQGRALAAQQRWADALPFFQRATERDPRNAEAWAELGRMLNEFKRNAEAVAAYDRALALNDQNASVWNNKGVVLCNLGRYEEALAAYDRALTLNPNDASAWYNKGDALDTLRRDEEALAAFDRALALDPHNANAWNRKGLNLAELGRYEEALAAYDQALAVDPSDAIAWNKGSVLRDLGRYEEALTAFDRALALDPDFAAAWYIKSAVLNDLRRYEEALAAYDRDFDRNDPMDWRAHARVYRALGHTAEAEEAERRAKELDG